jgi:predicted nucleic acid-binding protein
MVTTNHVRGETWTWLRSRSRHETAVAFLDGTESSATHTEVARLSEVVEADALDWLRQHDEREYSFVDATSFAYMRARGITEALAFDGDFAAAGFTELRP